MWRKQKPIALVLHFSTGRHLSLNVPLTMKANSVQTVPSGLLSFYQNWRLSSVSLSERPGRHIWLSSLLVLRPLPLSVDLFPGSQQSGPKCLVPGVLCPSSSPAHHFDQSALSSSQKPTMTAHCFLHQGSILITGSSGSPGSFQAPPKASSCAPPQLALLIPYQLFTAPQSPCPFWTTVH